VKDTVARAIPGLIKLAVDQWTEPFWLAGKEHRLVAPRCEECGTFRMPPSPFCPSCRSQRIDWVQLSGHGIVYSYTICDRSPFPGEVENFLFVPVIVELPDAQGVRLVSNLIDIEVQDVKVDLPVEIVWGPNADGWRVPLFRPRGP
jgi:uncharacterized OB-fold protein